MIARRLKLLAAAALVLREEPKTWVVVQFRRNLSGQLVARSEGRHVGPYIDAALKSN
jgi:hypothetical protein